MIICLKDISKEGFLFNCNIRIIKVPDKGTNTKTKFNFCQNQIYLANLRSSSNKLPDFASKVSSSEPSVLFCPLFQYP